MSQKKTDIDVEARMRELEEEIRRTVPPPVRAPEVDRSIERAPIRASAQSSPTSETKRGIIPSLGLAAVLVVGGVVSWYLIKHVVVTLFWVAALGVVGWAGWKIWRAKKVKDKGRDSQ